MHRAGACVVAGLAVCACLLAPLAAIAPPQLTGSSRFQAGSDEVTARLTRQIDRLLALFRPAGSIASDALIDALIAGDARSELFRMESLLRLYRHKFPNLTGHLREVKSIEDGLGEYAYAVDSLNFAKDRFTRENRTEGPSAQSDQEKVLDGLEGKRVAARSVLATLLQKTTFTSDLQSLRSQIGPRFRGWGTVKDRPFVKKELQQMLKKVRDGNYEFTRLEDGIHEFRRQLRWFPMTIDGLDGVVVVRDDPPGKCPVPALEALAGTSAARHKYANPALRHPASHPCAISRCLLWQVSKTIRDLGHLKDDAQGNAALEAALDEDLDISSSNAVTTQESERATRIRRELYSSRALDVLISQLSSCRP